MLVKLSLYHYVPTYRWHRVIDQVTSSFCGILDVSTMTHELSSLVRQYGTNYKDYETLFEYDKRRCCTILA